jgi:hypothetical protein
MDSVSSCQSAIHQKCTVIRFTEFHHFADGRIPMHATVRDPLGKPSRNSVGRQDTNVLTGLINR